VFTGTVVFGPATDPSTPAKVSNNFDTPSMRARQFRHNCLFPSFIPFRINRLKIAPAWHLHCCAPHVWRGEIPPLEQDSVPIHNRRLFQQKSDAEDYGNQNKPAMPLCP
jgi:hypothetical protein